MGNFDLEHIITKANSGGISAAKLLAFLHEEGIPADSVLPHLTGPLLRTQIASLTHDNLGPLDGLRTETLTNPQITGITANIEGYIILITQNGRQLISRDKLVSFYYRFVQPKRCVYFDVSEDSNTIMIEVSEPSAIADIKARIERLHSSYKSTCKGQLEKAVAIQNPTDRFEAVCRIVRFMHRMGEVSYMPLDDFLLKILVCFRDYYKEVDITISVSKARLSEITRFIAEVYIKSPIRTFREKEKSIYDNNDLCFFDKL